MIVLHAAAIMGGHIDGPEAVVPALIAAQNRCKHVETALVVTIPGKENLPQHDFPVFGCKAVVAKSGRLHLPAPFHKPHLAVFHGTYVPAQVAIAGKLRKAGIPYVICPHGGMTRYYQSLKRWKKWIGNVLVFNRMVAHARALHCLTRGEAEASRYWNRPIFVVGNGTDLPPTSHVASPGRSAIARLVFIGRLAVQHKGLDMLLDACALARSELIRRGARIELYGPDDCGSTKKLRKRVAALRLGGLVTVGEPVAGEAKTRVFKGADLFLHTSRMEGHPMAVLEALAHGLPCLLTPNTNVASEVAAAGAGWRAEPCAAGIADGLKTVLATEGHALREAGARARQLAASQYDWPAVASRTVKAYRRFAA